MKKKYAPVATAAVVVVGFALLATAGPAAADTVTYLSSFPDDRSDYPTNRSAPDSTTACQAWTSQNCIVRVRYGPYTIPGNGQLHNNIQVSAPAPCTHCRITDMVPDLVNSSTGASVNLQQGLMMHHFVLLNTGHPDSTCPSGGQGAFGERFFAAGNERTHVHLPQNFGYDTDVSNFVLIYHLVNKNSSSRSVYIEVTYRTRPRAGTQSAMPAWLDVDGCGVLENGFGDSEYTIPSGYSDFHDVDNAPSGGPYTADWTLPWDARLIGIGGHLHDTDITNASPCTTHCPALGGGIAVSAELRGGPPDYFGPSPPNNTPPTDLTGTTLCRSQAYYGTTYAAGRANGHLDTMSQCGIFTNVPAGAQPEPYPAAGAYSADGYPVRRNQVIRLHSEYQNGNSQPQTDAMGIMMAWFAINEQYPRPGGGSPYRVPLVPAYRQCTTAAQNSNHVAPLGQDSCSPAAEDSTVLTTATTGRQTGSARFDVLNGNPGTPADEADVRIRASVTDVRRKSDGADYVGKVLLESAIRVTDRSNGPAESGTVRDNVHLSAPLDCVATSDPAVGGTCSVDTTADSLLPGLVLEQKRTIVELLRVAGKDAGPNGAGYGAGCPPTCGDGDERAFLHQGVFLP
jgi:hypothetical protein